MFFYALSVERQRIRFYKEYSLSALPFSDEVMINNPFSLLKYNSLAITKNHILFFV